jgi:hypothetical protein
MPMLVFHDRAIEPVDLGIQKQSIRRGHHINVDDRLFLRSALTNSLLRSTHCDEVQDIHINSNTAVILNNQLLSDEDKHQLAIDEGFNNFKDMLQHFRDTGGLPVEGQLIKWL